MVPTKVFCFTIEAPKEQSAFIYFTLEANEGLCFYSTLEHKEGDEKRAIEIKGPQEFYQEVLNLLTAIKRETKWEFSAIKKDALE